MKNLRKNNKTLSTPIGDLKRVTPESKGQLRQMKKVNEEIEEVSTQDFEAEHNSLKEEFETVQAYNNNIKNHLPHYENFKPTNEVLIRIFRRVPVATPSGLMMSMPSISDFAKVQKTAGSGQQYSLKELAAGFKFMEKAVIVAKPDHIKYEIGKEVSIMPIEMNIKKIDDTTYHFYQGQYFDPDSGLVSSTSDCTNPHYGYALVPAHVIRGWEEVK